MWDNCKFIQVSGWVTLAKQLLTIRAELKCHERVTKLGKFKCIQFVGWPVESSENSTCWKVPGTSLLFVP